MSTQYVTSSILGNQVSFTSKNSTDATSYVGEIVGMISADIAGSYGDITSYNAAVQKADNTVGAINTLHYFLLKLSNGQTTPSIIVFANEWVADGSFSVVQNAQIYTINVYDMPSNGVSSILSVLRAAGYNAVQVTDPAILNLVTQNNTVTTTTTI